jgi:hypothetical protein
MITDTERIANALAAIGGMDKAVVEMAKAAAAATTDQDKADEAAIDILTAYQDLHTEALRIVAGV